MKKYLLSLLGFLCISCHAYLFEEYQNIPDEEWCIRNPIRFKIDIPEDGTYELLSGIRHTTDYEMANLWCFIKISDSTRVLFRDTLNIKLAKPDGRWLGDGFTIKSIEKELNKKPYLTQGEYTCEIEQGMRMQCLKGIKNVGLIVKKQHNNSTHGKKN